MAILVLTSIAGICLCTWLCLPLMRSAVSSGNVRMAMAVAAAPGLFGVAAAALLAGLAPGLLAGVTVERASGSRTTIDGEPLHPGMERMITELEGRLEASPDDAEGWALLARTLERTSRPRDSLSAYARAIELSPSDRLLAAEYAEARVLANDGVVDAIALDLFGRLMASPDPEAPDIGHQARYYLALHKAQSGDLSAALTQWRNLRADAPPGADWIGMLDAQISAAEEALGGSPAPAAAPKGPTSDQLAAASNLPKDQQQAMIEGMVGRLAGRLKENPDDLEGWRQLARSYDVLGRKDEAISAHRRVLELSPSDPDALWRLAFHEREAGRPAEARRMLSRLLGALPSADPRRADVETMLATLR